MQTLISEYWLVKKQANYKTIICNKQSEVIPDQALNNINAVFHLAGFTQYGT